MALEAFLTSVFLASSPTIFAAASDKQSLRSCDTRLRRVVTAADDMSTFSTRVSLQRFNIVPILSVAS